MKRSLIAVILGLGLSSSAFAATMPSAESCVRAANSSDGRELTNQCAYQIQVDIFFSDGNSDMEFINGYSRADGGDGHTSARWFACPTPSSASSNPNFHESVSYDTETFWCVR